MRVLESDLSPALKPLAITMALFGNDQGESIYPSIERVAHLLSVSRRHAERQLSELRRLGVLVPLDSAAGGRLPGGRGRSVLYRLDVEALPHRETFKPRHPRRGSETENPDIHVGDPGPGIPTSTSRTPTPVSPNPDIHAQEPRHPGRTILERDLREGTKRENNPAAPDGAASLSAKRENPKPIPRSIRHRCIDCDWAGDIRDATDHYRRTRHQMTAVDAEEGAECRP